MPVKMTWDEKVTNNFQIFILDFGKLWFPKNISFWF